MPTSRLDKLVVASQPKPPPRIARLAAHRPRETTEWLQAESRRVARWRRAHEALKARRRWFALLRATHALSRDNMPQYARMFRQARIWNHRRGLAFALDWLEKRYAAALLDGPYNKELDIQRENTIRWP